MKKTILILLSISTMIIAGGVKIDSAVDFTLTDVHGNTQHLFEYLDAGKWVVLGFTGQS